MKHFRLREQAGADPQTYALGLKEVWEVSKISMQQSVHTASICVDFILAWSTCTRIVSGHTHDALAYLLQHPFRLPMHRAHFRAHCLYSELAS